MSVIAIVGAGPGLGEAIAEQFGRQGFSVALIARNQDRLASIAARLRAEGITAIAVGADLLQPGSVAAALASVEKELGPIDVLEYSPSPGVAAGPLDPVSPRNVTLENVDPQLRFYLGGALEAADAVLPGMLSRGSGTLLFTTGASSVFPNPMFGNVGIGAGALRNWSVALSAELDGTGVFVGHVALGVWIGHGGPETETTAIAPLYWDLFVDRTPSERVYLG